MGNSDKPSTWGTSSTLIERVRAEEQEAWQHLCDIYAPLVYRWARRCRLQQTDADDVVQEVFRRVAIGIREFERGGPGQSFRGWLWTITRNVIRRHFNLHKGEIAKAEGGTHALWKLAQAPEELPKNEPPINASEELAIMRRALTLVEGDFNEHTWQAFWQFAVEGKPAKEVAADFGMTPAAVRQAKFRVLARLREVLG